MRTVKAELLLPKNSQLPPGDLHFLLYIPWNEKYLAFVPSEFTSFFVEVLPYLSARTTDVHTAVCLQYLDEFIEKAEAEGNKVNRKVLAYALILHDSGWSQMSEQEIAASLGVTGLTLTDLAMGPKEKHAKLGAEIATRILTDKKIELGLSDSEISLIVKAILFHDKPGLVAGVGSNMPIEVQLLVDLDHIWSFTFLNFWQDTERKGVDPHSYWQNLTEDLDTYFVTDIGRQKARELLAQRKLELE